MKWVVMKNFSRYEVSDGGFVRIKATGKLMKPYTDKDGYRKIRLFNDNGVRVTFYVHRLVWEAFNGEIPPGIEIDHMEGDRLNNSLDYLMPATKKQNARLKKQRDSNFLFNRNTPKKQRRKEGAES